MHSSLEDLTFITPGKHSVTWGSRQQNIIA